MSGIQTIVITIDNDICSAEDMRRYIEEFLYSMEVEVHSIEVEEDEL